MPAPLDCVRAHELTIRFSRRNTRFETAETFFRNTGRIQRKFEHYANKFVSYNGGGGDVSNAGGPTGRPWTVRNNVRNVSGTGNVTASEKQYCTVVRRGRTLENESSATGLRNVVETKPKEIKVSENIRCRGVSIYESVEKPARSKRRP